MLFENIIRVPNILVASGSWQDSTSRNLSYDRFQYLLY